MAPELTWHQEENIEGDARQIGELLQLNRQPVGIVFQSTAPEDTPKIDAAAVASCAYWKIAASGPAFIQMLLITQDAQSAPTHMASKNRTNSIPS